MHLQTSDSVSIFFIKLSSLSPVFPTRTIFSMFETSNCNRTQLHNIVKYQKTANKINISRPRIFQFPVEASRCFSATSQPLKQIKKKIFPIQIGSSSQELLVFRLIRILSKRNLCRIINFGSSSCCFDREKLFIFHSITFDFSFKYFRYFRKIFNRRRDLHATRPSKLNLWLC